MTTDGLPPAPWRAPRKAAARRDRPALSRDAIVAKAVEIIDAEGVDAVSMRRIATELGTGPASLYAYVAGKDELLAAAYELVMQELEVPNPDQAWQDVVRQWAIGTYELLGRHRDLAKLSFADIPTGPQALNVVEVLLTAMIGQGVAPHDAAWLMDRLALYLGADAFEGYLLQQRFNAADAGAAKAAGREWLDQVRQFFEALPKDRYPTLTANLPPMISGDGDERFMYGVDLMIAGVEARNPSSTKARRSRPPKRS